MLKWETFVRHLPGSSNGIASFAIFLRLAAFVYHSASFNVAQPKIDIS
jgi:hypothetical protein